MLNAPVSLVLFLSLFKKEMTIAELEKTARTLRLNIIKMIRVGQKGHMGSCDDCFILQAL
jgi:transketolase N-terminal domain/subunit